MKKNNGEESSKDKAAADILMFRYIGNSFIRGFAVQEQKSLESPEGSKPNEIKAVFRWLAPKSSVKQLK